MTQAQYVVEHQATGLLNGLFMTRKGADSCAATLKARYPNLDFLVNVAMPGATIPDDKVMQNNYGLLVTANKG